MSQLATRVPTPLSSTLPPRPPRRPPVAGTGFSEGPDDRLDLVGFLTPDEFSRLLKVSRAKFFKMKAAGLLPQPVYVGRLPRWRCAEVIAWMKSGCPASQVWLELRDKLLSAIRTGGGR